MVSELKRFGTTVKGTENKPIGEDIEKRENNHDQN
jgi:hypothetical protein